MPYDWSIPYDSPLVYDVGNPSSATLTGIPSAGTFGTAAFQPTGSVNIQLTGIPSLAAFGTQAITAPKVANLTGIPSLAAFGVIGIVSPVIVQLHALPSAETFGASEVSQPLATFTPKLIQSKSSSTMSGNSGQITPSNNITAGNVLIVAAAINSPTNITGVTDAAGNLYQNSVTNIDSGSTTLTIWVAPITAGSGTKPAILVHTTGTNLVYSFFWEYSGVSLVNPIDAFGVSSGTGNTGTAVSSGFLSTAFIADVLCGICICQSNVTGATAGWTATPGFANARIEAEVFVTSATGSFAATFTQTSAVEYNAAIASFAPAAVIPVSQGRVL
jgi:hypothetical protein